MAAIDSQPVSGAGFFDRERTVAAAGFNRWLIPPCGLSLFNIGGRFFWAALSDRLGRKATYAIMLALGALLFGLVATYSAKEAILLLFVASFCITTSMYGGGFATVPAYLADVFGTRFVGAIHGRLLTAWSVAGVLGGFIVTAQRDGAIARHAARAGIYPPIYLILAGLLIAGFVANLMIRPVAEKWRIPASEGAAVAASSGGIDRGRFDAMTAVAWAVVILPLIWGVAVTLIKASALFK